MGSDPLGVTFPGSWEAVEHPELMCWVWVGAGTGWRLVLLGEALLGEALRRFSRGWLQIVGQLMLWLCQIPERGAASVGSVSPCAPRPFCPKVPKYFASLD